MLARSPMKRRSTPLNRVGKKGRANAKANRERRPKFEAMGVTRCEVNFEGCTGGYDVTWAHGRKRRKLLPGELEDFVCVACTRCHRRLDEEMTHEEMADKVREIVNNRETRLAA
jgi:hypothetical protein